MVGLLSCSKSSPSPQTHTLQIHLGGEPTVLNPILSTDSPSSSVEGLIFFWAFRINSDLELEPDLLESYDVSDDGTVYTFVLKKNIKWHDGHPFSAQDVKFTFDTILDKRTNTVRRSNFIIGKHLFNLMLLIPIPFKQNSQNRLHRFLIEWQWAFYHGTYCKMWTLIKHRLTDPLLALALINFGHGRPHNMFNWNAMMGITLVLQKLNPSL